MKSRVLAVALTAALTVTLGAGMAWARNPHCSGGIQYLTQALADKKKGSKGQRQHGRKGRHKHARFHRLLLVRSGCCR